MCSSLLPPVEGVLLCAYFLDAVVGCVSHPKLSICPIVRQYVPLSYLVSICPIVRQYVPLSYLVSICPIVRQYLPVLFLLFFSPYAVHVGTCLLFPFSRFVLCVICDFTQVTFFVYL